jgi:hypothetical protein
LSLAVRSRAPQAGKIINTNHPKFDVRVQVRSNAEEAVKDLADKIAMAYYEHSELIYEEDDPFTFGPIRVVKEGAVKFANSLYPQYGKLGTEELAFAKGLDAANVIWHRNPVSGGWSIPLVTDRRNGAKDVRRNGASFWLLNRAPEGVEERGYFAALAGVDLTLPAVVLGARYDAPSRTMQ